MMAQHTSLRDELIAIIGPRGVLERDDFAGRSCDPFTPTAIASPLVARPANAEELSQVVKAAVRHGFKIVTHGGLTGLSGGALTRPDTIVVSTERMRQIERIDELGQYAVVGAGVPVEELHNAAEAHGLFYPIDLGSKGSATIGGTIATNAGGNHVIRWGMTRQNILGLEAVLADGTVVDAMNSLLKNNMGYDLKHVLIGTEGTLGIVTRAVVKLAPLPTTQDVAFLAVESMEKLLHLLVRARAMPTLSAFEVMWQDYYGLMATHDSARRPVEPNWPYYVLVETMGYDEEHDRALFERFVEDVFESGLAADGVLATSDRQKQDLWHVREGSEITIREFGSIAAFDISVDLEHVEQFVDDAYAALRRHFGDVRGVTLGHLGDNNIHLAINVGDDTVARTHEIEDVVFKALAPFGGSITAEHGIGVLKKDFLHQYKSKPELDMMKRIKAALDPDGVLNPDVIF